MRFPGLCNAPNPIPERASEAFPATFSGILEDRRFVHWLSPDRRQRVPRRLPGAKEPKLIASRKPCVQRARVSGVRCGFRASASAGSMLSADEASKFLAACQPWARMRLSSKPSDPVGSLIGVSSVSHQRSIQHRGIYRHKSCHATRGAAMNHRGDPAIDGKGNGFQQLFFRFHCVSAGGLLAVRLIKQKGTAETYGV